MMNTTIHMEGASRPCMVHLKDGNKRGLFHGWFQCAWPYEAVLQGTVPGFIQRPQAVIEFEDGSVTQVNAGHFHFIDAQAVFSQYCWDTESGDAS